MQLVSTFFQLLIGGVIVGLVIGLIATYWIKKISNDEILIINITLIASYLVYFISQNINIGYSISGIMALVSLGVFMSGLGKSDIGDGSQEGIF